MNCKTFETLILLKDSGEVTESETRTLENHLNTCTTCRDMASDLASLRHVFQNQQDVIHVPASTVLETIRVTADEKISGIHWVIHPLWKVALAAAACFVIFLTGIRFMAPSLTTYRATSPEYSIAAEILPLVDLVMGNSDSSMDLFSGESDLTILADHMLILQGVKIDSGEDLFSEFMVPEDTVPTTLQWNNNFESHLEKCV